MKKLFKLFGMLVLAAVIGFSFITCEQVDYSTLLEEADLSKYPLSPAKETQQAFNDTDAVTFVSGIKLGWNLGNTLDAHAEDGYYSGAAVSSLETQWVNQRTTQHTINAIKNAGFNTIRIPVTWYKVANARFDIRDDWMKRVTEIVNYAYDEGMYVILNTHHDEYIFKFFDDEVERSLIRFQKIWMQIAAQFKNYGERLIFEGLNEPRTKGSPREWQGGTAEEQANLNKHHQAFVDVVRASGGNNDKRFLMISTYAASAWATAVNALVLPTDTSPDRLIVSIHAYEPFRFALSTNATFNTWSITNSADTTQIINTFNEANKKFVTNGIPVIMGEFGAMNKNNEPARAAWAEYYVGHARSLGIPCIWWDNGAVSGTGELFGLLNRSTNTFHYPVLLEGLKRGAGLE